jgi:hypothetical protein
MAKTAFAVEDGITPGHTTSHLGHTNNKFGNTYLSGDLNADGDINAAGTVFSAGEEISGGGGGGGVDAATSIAYAIALGSL